MSKTIDAPLSELTTRKMTAILFSSEYSPQTKQPLIDYLNHKYDLAVTSPLVRRLINQKRG